MSCLPISSVRHTDPPIGTREGAAENDRDYLQPFVFFREDQHQHLECDIPQKARQFGLNHPVIPSCAAFADVHVAKTLNNAGKTTRSFVGKTQHLPKAFVWTVFVLFFGRGNAQ